MPAFACTVESSVVTPHSYALSGGHHSSIPSLASFFGAPLLPRRDNVIGDKNDSSWSASLSSSLYKVDAWGAPYFFVNDSGNISVRPFGSGTLPHQEIDMLKVVKKATDPKFLGGLDLPLPLIMRFPDVLKNRLEHLQAAFDYAIVSSEYESRYQGVYPVKCNQDKFVVEDIVKFGYPFRFGLEAGSKPELLLAMNCLCKGNPEAFLVCNGYKDEGYISLALFARKLSLNSFIVLEKEEEVDLVISLSKKLNVRPVIGFRAKLRTKHHGHFGSTSGEKGKFGLTTTQIIRVVKRLEEENMLDCLKLLHFHIGSQIPSTALLADGVREAAQIYCELVHLGAGMEVVDIGGGLGIDYDGSKSGNSDLSVSYNLEEYAQAVVETLKSVCDMKNVKHPVICSESGRALVSHHSVLIFEAVSSSSSAPPHVTPFGLQCLVEALTEEAHSDYITLMNAAVLGDRGTTGVYAESLKQKCVDLFREGVIGLEQLAAADGLCELVFDDMDQQGEPVQTYHVNLSVFTSIPDFWGVGQLFPILPIHRLEERPSMRGILSDLTCDSDGKVDKFINGESSLPLHAIGDGSSRYYLGMFLGGAYQEAIGGLHNLFGGPSVVRVTQSEGPHCFAVTRAMAGQSCSDVLRVMQHEPEMMFETLKHRAEELCVESDSESDALINAIHLSFHGTPYLMPPCSLRHMEYDVVAPSANGEEDQWSFCFA